MISSHANTMKIPRFSLRTLFVATTIVAIFAAIFGNPTASMVFEMLLFAGMLWVTALGILAGILRVFVFGILRDPEGGKRWHAILLGILTILLSIAGFYFFGLLFNFLFGFLSGATWSPWLD